MKKIKEKEIVKTDHKKIIIFFTIVLILLIGIGTFFFFNMNSNKNKFLNLVNKKYDEIIEKFKNPQDNTIGIVKDEKSYELGIDLDFNIVADFKDESIMQILTFLDNFKLNLKVAQNFKEQESYMLFNSTYKDKEFIAINYYETKNGTYILLPKVFDKYIKVDKTEIPTTTTVSYENNEYMMRKIKDSLLGGLKESDFNSHVETIKIDGKNYNAEKLSLTLNEERIEAILIKVVNDLKNDKKISELLGDIDSEQMIKDIKKEIILKENIKFDLFVYQEEIIQSEITNGTKKLFRYQSELNSSKQTLNFYVENIPFITLEIDKISEEKTTYSLTSLGDALTVTGSINNKKEIIENNKKWKDNLDFNFKLNSLEETLDFRMNAIINVDTEKDIVLPTITNYVRETEMTKEDNLILENYLFEKMMLITNENQK